MNGMNGMSSFTEKAITVNRNTAILIAIGQKIGQEFTAEAKKYSRFVHLPTSPQRTVRGTCTFRADRGFFCFCFFFFLDHLDKDWQDSKELIRTEKQVTAKKDYWANGRSYMHIVWACSTRVPRTDLTSWPPVLVTESVRRVGRWLLSQPRQKHTPLRSSRGL